MLIEEIIALYSGGHTNSHDIKARVNDGTYTCQRVNDLTNEPSSRHVLTHSVAFVLGQYNGRCVLSEEAVCLLPSY